MRGESPAYYIVKDKMRKLLLEKMFASKYLQDKRMQTAGRLHAGGNQARMPGRISL